ncbi:DUF2737 family protein, partial [Escherichia coli]|nr:DUF2737 family protein [Escherichia coli]
FGSVNDNKYLNAMLRKGGNQWVNQNAWFMATR